MIHRHWILFGNPENRRIELFQKSLRDIHNTQATVFSYEELLNGDISTLIKKRLANKTASQIFIKFESPGENTSVTRQLVAKGCENGLGRISPFEALSREYEHGRFSLLKEHFFGFRQLITEINQSFEQWAIQNENSINYLNPTAAIVDMLDKLTCQNILRSTEVNTPKLIEVPESFEDFLSNLRERRIANIFIKPRYGSSAAGVIALKFNYHKNRLLANSSLELIKESNSIKCFNNLKVRRYENREDIKALYDTIYTEDAYAEHWIPKPQINGLFFDLRIVVTKGQATHYVVRTSKGPMTNLHLGNQRGNIFDRPDGETLLKIAKDEAVKAASSFPNANSIGADVVVSPKRKHAHILELNAFGDLLPNVHNKGLDTYATQIDFMNDRKEPTYPQIKTGTQ